MTPLSDTDVRELVAELRSPRHAGFDGEDLLLEAATALESLLSRIAKLEERVRELTDALQSIRHHVEPQPSPLAKAIVATVDAALNRSTD